MSFDRQDGSVRLSRRFVLLGLLSLCVLYGLLPTLIATVLPRQGTETLSCEYGLRGSRI
jgi:hypothetical protein